MYADVRFLWLTGPVCLYVYDDVRFVVDGAKCVCMCMVMHVFVVDGPMCLYVYGDVYFFVVNREACRC